MGCRSAERTDEYHGWKCNVTDGECMFLFPDEKACFEKYGEGPLTCEVWKPSGLVIKEFWLNKSFDEEKDWELRGSKTSKRGKILLIQSGSGMIMGECNLIACMELDAADFTNSKNHHKIQTKELPYEKTYAWVL